MPQPRASEDDSHSKGQKPPTWTVLRRGEACLQCRTHKTKCDGAKPSCRQCVSVGRECEYVTTISRLRKLEARVKELETQVLEATKSSSSDASSSASISEPSPSRFDSLYSAPSNSPLSVDLTLHISQPPRMSRNVGIQSIHSWNPDSELPPSLRLHLFNEFLDHSSQYNVDIYLPRFRESMNHPESHPESLHSVFVNAIFLAACSGGGPEMKPYEDEFLRRSREQAQHSLIHRDRLEHFLWASIIIAWYYIRNGRMHEAYHISSTMVRFALACGLDQISDPSLYARDFSSELIPPPRDAFHVTERINLWWSVYTLDRFLSLSMGLPGGLPDDAPQRITTPWPLAFSTIARCGLSCWPKSALAHLVSQHVSCTTVISDTLLALQAKCIALRAHITWSVYDMRSGKPEAFWATYTSTEAALTQYQATMPSVMERSPINTGEYIERVNPTLVHVHISLHASAIMFYRISDRPSDQVKRVKAAQCIAKVTRNLGDPSILYAPACLGPGLYSAAEVLIEEIDKMKTAVSTNDVHRLRILQQDLASISHTLSSMIRFYPGLVPFNDRIRWLLSSLL